MGQVRLALAAIAAGVILALGCSALTGLDSLNEVSCADAACAPAEASVEGGAPADATIGDAPHPDARPSDGSVPDAPRDAWSDAGSGDAATDVMGDVMADAPTLGWCASHPHTFCADFDEGSVTLGWSGTEVPEAGSLSLDNGAFTSPPDSMLSIVMASSSSNMSARQYETFNTTYPKIVLAYDVLVDASNPADVALVSSVYFGGYHEHLRMVGGQTLFVEFFNPSDGGASGDLATYTASTPIVPGAWTHVEIDFFLATGGSPYVNVLLNGTTVIQNGTLSIAISTLPPEVHVGLYFLSSNGAWQAHYDNVAVDFPP